MAESRSPHEENGSNSQREAVVDERTSLLSANNGNPYDHSTTSPDESTIDEDFEAIDIDPNEFDNLLSRAESISTGLGIEIESQETAMLRGPRRYSVVKGGSRAPSQVRSRRKSHASTIGSSEEAIDDVSSEEDAETKPKSPFLAGVSVGTFWLIFSGILIAHFVACFDSTIMVSSHPVITSYFQSSNSASWLSTAFLLTSTSFQPLFGRLSDTIGRKSPYVFTMTLFLVATIWCALAQSMTSFIIARAVCGLGAGGMMAMGSIITSDLVPIEIRGTYQSYINIIYGAGSAAGAALGGAIADSLGWRWEFGVQVPLLFVCVLVSFLTLPKKLGLAEGTKKKTLWEAMKVFDYKGSLLLTTSITFLILGLVRVYQLQYHLTNPNHQPESRRQHLPLGPPHCPRLPCHFQHRLPPLHLHGIPRLPSDHAPRFNSPQPTRRPHPRQFHRRYNHERSNLQHPSLLPSGAPRKRHNVWSPTHCSLCCCVGCGNSHRFSHYLDEANEMAIGDRRDIAVYWDGRAVVHAARTAGLDVPILPGSFLNGSGIHVPSSIHECPCCLGAGRTGSCDKYVDFVEINGYGFGCGDEQFGAAECLGDLS
jgi:hypothetical protein